MLITKFNKMIRNKLIWGIIAVVVSLFFVLSFSSMKSCSKPRSYAVGKLFNKEISPQTLRQAVFFEIGMGNQQSLTPEAYQLLEERAWIRLALLDVANQLGITSSDKDVATAIQREPGFNENGMFSRERYRAFVRSRNLSVRAFEAYVRETLTIQKLIGVMETMVWTSPFELSERLRNLVDSRVVDYALIPEESAPSATEVSEEEARAFYERDPEAFRIPERVSVRFVDFPITNNLPDSIPDSEIEDYYNTNIGDYTPLSTNAYDLPTPLEEVRDDIVNTLKHQRAIFNTKDLATEFVVELAPDRYGHQMPWDQVAETRGYTVHTSRLFAIEEPLHDLGVGLDFNIAAFSLIADDPERYFSDAIIGSNAVYVIAALHREASRTPEFEAVREAAIPAALADARRQAFNDYVSRIYDSVREALATNLSFAATLDSWGLSSTSTPPFNVIGGLPTNEVPYANAIVPAVVSLYQGEIAESIPVENGALLVYVAERTPGDRNDIAALRPQLLGTLQDYRTGILFDAWGEYVLKLGGFEDMRDLPEPDDTDEPVGLLP